MNKLTYLLIALLLSFSLSAEQNENIVNDWPDSRYRGHGHGDSTVTVTDTKTGLMWMQCSLGQNQEANASCSDSATTHNWEDALETAFKYTFAGYSDWRLPNLNELRSLVAYDRYDPAINSAIFPNTPMGGYFWSSSPSSYNGEDTRSWGIRFDDGYDSAQLTRSSGYYVRLVRTDQ